MSGAAELAVNIVGNNAALLRSLAQSERAGRGFSRNMQVAGAYAAAGVAAVGVAAASAAVQIHSVAMESAAQAREIRGQAAAANLTVIELQAVEYATRKLGMEQGKGADIMKDFNDKFGEFTALGGGEFADFLEDVGPKIGVTSDQLKELSGPQALIAIKKAMDDANVPMREQIHHLEAIADDGAALIPLLAENGKKWRELREEFIATNTAMTDSEMSRFEDYAKDVDQLSDSWDALVRESAAPFLAHMREIAHWWALVFQKGRRAGALDNLGDATRQVEKLTGDVQALRSEIETLENGGRVGRIRGDVDHIYSRGTVEERIKLRTRLLDEHTAKLKEAMADTKKWQQHVKELTFKDYVPPSEGILPPSGSDKPKPNPGGGSDDDDGEAARAAARLAAQQARSRSTLQQLDLEYAQEQEKLWLHHQARLDKISELQLSEKQIKSAGFSDMAALQEAYGAESLALYERQKTELQAREIEDINRIREHKRTEVEQIRAGLIEKDQLELENWQKRQIKLAEWYVMEREAFAENQAELARIEQEYRWLSAENDRQYRDNLRVESDDFWANYAQSIRETAENTDQIWANTLTSISGRTSSVIMDSMRDWQGMGNFTRTLFAGVGEAVIQTLIDIGVQRMTLWALEKTIGISTGTGYVASVAGQASSQVAMAGLNAFSSTAAIPIVGPIMAPAAMSAALAVASPMAATAITAATSSLAGMAHSGIDEVPREGTWLLDRGERVYTNESAERIDEMYSKIVGPGGPGGAGGSGMTLIVNNQYGPDVGVSPSVLDENTMEIILERVDADQAQRTMHGTGLAAQANETAYGLSRGRGTPYG